MKTIVCVCLLVAAAAAFPQDLRALQIAPVIQRTEIRDESNQFSESYQTHDGQAFVERGVLKPTPDGSDYVLVKTGSFQYTSPEGVPIAVYYTADENGFHPTGKHLPVPPAPAAPSTFF